MNTFITLFLKLCGLKGKVASTSAGSYLQNLVVIFTEEYYPITLLFFPSLFSPDYDFPVLGSMVLVTCPQ